MIKSSLENSHSIKLIQFISVHNTGGILFGFQLRNKKGLEAYDYRPYRLNVLIPQLLQKVSEICLRVSKRKDKCRIIERLDAVLFCNLENLESFSKFNCIECPHLKDSYGYALWWYK